MNTHRRLRGAKLISSVVAPKRQRDSFYPFRLLNKEVRVRRNTNQPLYQAKTLKNLPQIKLLIFKKARTFAGAVNIG
jgi:hypothetical protein